MNLTNQQNGILSSVPYLGMWISSILLSMMADWLITTNKFSITVTRKIFNSIGQFGPAICLAVVSYTGCNRVLTVFLLTIGISLNGGIYSGFKVILIESTVLETNELIDSISSSDKSFRHFSSIRWNLDGD